MKNKFFILAAAMLAFALVFTSQVFSESDQQIVKGKKVSIEYLLRLADGTVIDSNVGKEPLTYTQGESQIIPGLERQLEGLKAGDARKIEVSPKEGYGEYDAALVQEFPKSVVASQDGLAIDAKLYTQDDKGRFITAVVKEVKKDTVVLDMNSPLAGKMLYFDIKILKVE